MTEDQREAIAYIRDIVDKVAFLTLGNIKTWEMSTAEPTKQQIIDSQTAFANLLFIVSYNLDNVLKSEVQP